MSHMPFPEPLAGERLLRAQHFIDTHYHQPLDLAAIAAEAGFSRFHFLRLFQASFGQTPHQYLRQQRIAQARELLSGSELDVTEICFAVGFQSLGSFSSLFHRLVGQPPTSYRVRVFTGWRARRAYVPMCFIRTFGARMPRTG